MIHRQQRSPLPGLDDQPALSQMRVEGFESEIGVGMSPAKERVEYLDIHTARFFEKKTSTWLKHADDLIDNVAPVWNVMQDPEDDNRVFAGIGKLT